ncbi:phage tail domain-containing protein [Streptosporangium sp. NPDC020072]|uniref:phage distal tail protein n=1 Tax=Streptosporangium sp. NPDC020072 TaxID=3154788 RepID=UPI0034155971
MPLWPQTRLVWLPNQAGAVAVTLASGEGVSPSGVAVQPGARGFDAPTFQYSYTETPALDGAHINRVRIPSREIFIPVYIEGSDRGDFLEKKRSLLRSLNPLGSNGAGRLYVVEGDSSTRTIDMHYFDGAEGDYGVDVGGFHWQRYGLRFMALDPYFYSSTVETRTWRGDVEDLVPFFSSPFLGLHLAKTLSFNGQVTLDVYGDVDTWPIWYVTGPLEDVTFVNHSIGQSFTLTHQLLSGQSVTIDTTPGKKTVRLDGVGTNLWDKLGPNPQIWPIAPYWNEIELTVNGVTNETEITLEYRPRYLSA